jgi:hypothetical protein
MDLLGDWWTPLVLREAFYGIRRLAGEEGPLTVFHHELCGRDTHAEVVCASCGDPMRAQDTTMRMGPGYPDRLKSRPDVRRRFSAGPTALTG